MDYGAAPRTAQAAAPRAAAYDAPSWADCVPHGCVAMPLTNESHAYPWLASLVSLTFLGVVAGPAPRAAQSSGDRAAERPPPPPQVSIS